MDREDLLFLAETARRLVQRLERLSADSFWAHQASGLRGSLLRGLEEVETGRAAPAEWDNLAGLVARGMDILQKAAREIRPPET